MAQFDLPLEQLAGYTPELAEPADFDAFWKSTLDEAAAHDLAAVFTPVDTGLALIESYDVTFAGYGGEPVRGWLHLPVHRDGPLPCVVQYAGYGGGRGLAHESVLWAVAGHAHFVMDTRGQGSAGSIGDTPDPHGSTPAVPGFMTRGILDPAGYYYRRVFTDAVRAVAAARSHPAVDRDRVAAAGGSQGGGIALAVAGLVPDLAAVMADVPFLCHFRRATELTDAFPYAEIAQYLGRHRDHLDTVFDTLSYFDGALMARRGTAPALFSVALMDVTCPPSTVYAAYNGYPARKEIRVYPYNDHEGGQSVQQAEQLRWLSAEFGR
ncbi:acetylxylan esterase [Streptomyces sp. CA-111067]|uniref:acetylxylan esterase n=1 Tax=Streptomyces sp. CA-111067 TaxID=3240046 RepID=UPI003D99813C